MIEKTQTFKVGDSIKVIHPEDRYEFDIIIIQTDFNEVQAIMKFNWVWWHHRVKVNDTSNITYDELRLITSNNSHLNPDELYLIED